MIFSPYRHLPSKALLFFLIIILFGGSGSAGKSKSIGYYDAECNYNETTVNLKTCNSTLNSAITLEEYVSRMKEGQDCIYYACGENNDKVDNMPQVEGIKEKGSSTLLFPYK